MTIKRWLPTFLAFPLGGFLAWVVVGSLDGPLTAAAGGLIAGAVIGAAQWLALGTTKRWIPVTAGAMAAGTALAAAVTGAGTELGDLIVSGAIAGAVVGAAQSTILGAARTWTVATAGSWALAWLISYEVIGAGADQGFFVFGSSGALVATLITGLVLRSLQGSRQAVAA